MAELKASVVLDLVDRISRPIQRIQRRFGRLAQSAELQRLRQSVAAVGQNFGNVVSAAGRLARRLTMAGGTVAGAAWGFERFLSGVTDVADRVGKLSERLGVNVQTLQEWQYGANLSGISTETFNMSLQRFARRIGEAANGTGEARGAVRYLGVALRDAEGNIRSTEELLPEFADALAGVENEQSRLALAMKLFDSEGVAMLQMLNGGSEALREFAREAHRADVVMTEEFIEHAEEYTNSMHSFRQSLFGLRIAIVEEVLPGVTKWIKEQTKLIRLNREDWVTKITGALKGFWEGLKNVAALLQWTSELLGGWGRVAMLVGAVLLAPLVAPVFMLAAAILQMGVALLAIGAPAAIAVGAIAAIAGGVYLLYRYWDDIAGWFSERFERVTRAFEQDLVLGVLTALREFNPAQLVSDAILDLIDYLTGIDLEEYGARLIRSLGHGMARVIDSITSGIRERIEGMFSWMPDWMQSRLGMEGASAGPRLGPPVLDGGASEISALGGQGVGALGGELGFLRIEVNQDGRVRSVTPERRREGFDMDVDLGVGVMP